MKLICKKTSNKSSAAYSLYLDNINVPFLTSSKYWSHNDKLWIAANKINTVLIKFGDDERKTLEHFQSHQNELPEGVELDTVR
jgi:hypothetical protein